MEMEEWCQQAWQEEQQETNQMNRMLDVMVTQIRHPLTHQHSPLHYSSVHEEETPEASTRVHHSLQYA